MTTTIITDKLKRNLLAQLSENIDNTADRYYIGIGRSDQWNDSDIEVPVLNSSRVLREARNSLQSIISAESYSYVVPRYDWTAGTVYKAFNDADTGPTVPTYYVTNNVRNVYICLQQGKNASGASVVSTVQPSGEASTAFSTADGYVWKFLYPISSTVASAWLSSNFMPVKYIDSASDVFEGIQKTVQDASVSGQIIGIDLTAAGTGYTSAPTVVITGNGTLASATATVASGAVVKIEMNESDGTILFGSGYTDAKITLTGGAGSNAAASPIFAELDSGFGANPLVDLRSKAIMFNAKPSGTEAGKFIINNDFRQTMIIKNPKTNAGVLYEVGTGIALNSIVATSAIDAASFTNDQILTGANSGSKAIVDYIDSDVIYYHQNNNTGFGLFDSDISALITGTGSASATIASLDSSDIDAFSGDMLYLGNSAAISRSSTQTEDIKLVIQL
jgi:hypothetical protein